MKIGIFGSGSVGQRVGAKLVVLGHAVMPGTRDPSKLSDWLAARLYQHFDTPLVTFKVVR